MGLPLRTQKKRQWQDRVGKWQPWTPSWALTSFLLR